MRMWPWGNELCGGLHWRRGEGQVAGGQSSQKRMPDSHLVKDGGCVSGWEMACPQAP